MTFEPGDIVKIGLGMIDWEVVGSKPDGRVILSSGMTGRRCVVKPEQLSVWRANFDA